MGDWLTPFELCFKYLVDREIALCYPRLVLMIQLLQLCFNSRSVHTRSTQYLDLL
jgi:hypothetical protein